MMHPISDPAGQLIPTEWVQAAAARWPSRAVYIVEGKVDEQWVPLPQYAGAALTEVLQRITERARKEGYVGNIVDRIEELGWRIVPYVPVAEWR